MSPIVLVISLLLLINRWCCDQIDGVWSVWGDNNKHKLMSYMSLQIY